MKKYPIILSIGTVSMLLACSANKNVSSKSGDVSLTKVQRATLNDSFWSPKFDQWRTVTANDVLDKFEAKHLATAEEQKSQNVFTNFDDVAKGKKGTGHHAGLPWFDGLI